MTHLNPRPRTHARTRPLPRLRLVASGLALLLGLAQPAWAAAPFTVNGDATVTDSTTSLVWDQCPYGLSGTTCATGTALNGIWAGALGAAVAANAASYKGFTDWRVPNKNELESIAKIDTYTAGQPAIDTTAFPGTPLSSFWTSTNYAPLPSRAWFVYFDNGNTYAYNKTGTYYVRLVRSGQPSASFDAFPPLSSQTITFTNPGTQTLGTTPTLTATASSGLTPTFMSSTTGVCTITSGGGLTLLTTGTCGINADQAGNGSYSAAPQVSQSFAVNLASQTITFGAAPSVIVGGTGTVTSTGGGSGVARVYASSTPAACTVNSSTGVVTGVAAGTNNCTITVDQAGNTNYSAAPQASLSFGIGAAPVVTPPPSIAFLPISIGGLSTSPAILNMADGTGPDFMTALVRMLSNTLAQPLQFVEQNGRGTVSLRGFNGGNLAFIPYGFQTGDNRADGIYPQGNGQYQVVINGQQISLAPATVNLNQLTTLLPGIVASQAGNGVITATLNGVTYVVQAGVAVQLDLASANAQLVTGSDGLLHFIDTLGNNQVLYPAFSEPGALRNILRGMDLATTLSIQLDGTAAIVYNGQRYTLVPDLTLLAVPADRAGQDWWQESATRFRVTNMETFPWRVWSQGFTVRQP